MRSEGIERVSYSPRQPRVQVVYHVLEKRSYSCRVTAV